MKPGAACENTPTVPLALGERRSVVGMAVVIVLLHGLGFGVLVAVVVPHGYWLGGGGVFTVGLGVTAWALGLRHAFDADHIAAIDNATRRLMGEGGRPLSVGFWFSLGHSSVVLALTFLLAVGLRALAGPVAHGGSRLHDLTGGIGTLVSGGFLYLIAALNFAVLLGIARIFIELRRGRFDEAALEQRLAARGLLNRVLGPLTRAVGAPRQMYLIGVLFGLGFDTATEVALLVVAGSAGAAGLPFYAILCLPVLFAGGMCLCDTIDAMFMNLAYGWAFAAPVRRVFYNLAVTGLSVAVALVIATIELSGLLARKLSLSGSFWAWWERIDLNLLGFVIVGVFVVIWAVALTYWRLAHVEQRWSARLADQPAPD